jgi:hypothetical protein
MHPTKTLVAAIVDFNIYLNSDHVFIASVKLLHVNEIFIFGGEKLFSFIECRNDPRYLNDILGTAVTIQVFNKEITGMSSLTAQDWFFPVLEFNVLKEAGEPK